MDSTPFLVPLPHGDAPDPTGWIASDWSVEPTVLLGVIVVSSLYLMFTGAFSRRPAGEPPVSRGQRAAFLGGSLVLLIALGPPLDDWADHYLLTAHMGQHLLLTLVVAPLWLLGIPPWLLQPLTRWRIVDRVGYTLTRPLVAFVIANLVFAVWHVPVFYEAALRQEILHILEHQLFLVTGLLAWWPVVGPLPAWPRLSLPLQCLYLVASTIPGGIIGAIITFAAPGLYAPYDTADRIAGLSVQADQELGGLLMWVGSSTIYLALFSVIFFRWAAREERADRDVPPVNQRPSPVGR